MKIGQKTLKEYHITDGVWHDIHSHMSCCDCGLVHRIEYRQVGKKLQARAWRCKKLTAENRKQRKLVVPPEGFEITFFGTEAKDRATRIAKMMLEDRRKK